MSQFEQVTVLKKANVFFDGGVTSHTVLFANGEKKTLGVMQPGEYEFNVGKKEIMEIQAGDCDVLLAGHAQWQHFSGGQQFEVPANTLFKIKAITLVDYCCSFVD